MTDLQILWYGEKELKNPIAIIGFPGVGLVGSIISSFLARELKLDIVAGVTNDDLPPYCLMQDGKPYPPIRIYAGSVPKKKGRKPKDTEVFVKDGSFIMKEEEPTDKVDDEPVEVSAVTENSETEQSEVTSETEKTNAETEIKPETETGVETDKPSEKKVRKRTKSRDVIVITSEVTPKPEQMRSWIATMIEAAGKLGATEYIFLDGVPKMNETDGLIAAGSSEEAKERIKEAELEPLDDGLVRGLCGIALYEGFAKGLNVIALMCTANPQLPDPRSSTELLLPLSLLVPRMFLDATPLFKEADEIDIRIREQQNSQTNNQNLYG
ncbi:MAG: PAC2 family protein [archaeon]|nr:PAC2 family protein [archaeon]